MPSANVRYFFEAFMAQGSVLFSENHIPLAGQSNFRDLGGYQGANGKYILFGRLYRSGKLSGVTTGDLIYLSSMALASVIDLRSVDEVADEPDLLPGGVVYYNYSLSVDFDFNKVLSQIVSGQADAYQTMIDFYSEDIDQDLVDAWTDIFDVIEESAPVMFHCSGGKDRTGMTAVLLLLALGVDRDMVITDYTKSDYYLADWIDEKVAEVDKLYPGSGELVRPMLESKPEYMETFLETVERDFGTVDNFLRNIIDVNVDLLRQRYLQ